MTILLLPFTLSTAEWVTDPATFVALQVYSPMWVKSTSEMINMLVLVPTIVVVMLGPEFNFWPLRLQVMVTRMCPQVVALRRLRALFDLLFVAQCGASCRYTASLE